MSLFPPRIDVFLHTDDASESVTRKLDTILTRLEHFMAEIDTLTAQVKANTDVEASALILINGIADRIAAAGVDPTKLATLTNSLKSSADQLSAAVVANTPVMPVPPVVPVV